MEQFEAKMSGTWLQSEITGDISSWLTMEGIGFAMRQVMWFAGYGNGKVKLSIMLKDGHVYCLSELDENFAHFRYHFQIDGQKHPILFSEGVPFMQFRNFSVQSTMNQEGVIETSMFSDKDGAIHNKSERRVSDDGNELITDITFYEGAAEHAITIKHTRVATAKLSLDECIRWCPNVQLGEVKGEAGEDYVSAIVPLDGRFASTEELLNLIERVKRTVEQEGDDTKELTEVSPSEFNITIKKASGETEVYAHKFDKTAAKLFVDYTKDGNMVATATLTISQDPFRVEYWCTIPDKFVATVLSIAEVQKTLDKALCLAQVAGASS